MTVEASDGTDSSTLEVTVTVTNLIDDFRVQGSARGSATESNTGSDGSGIAMTSLSYPENGTAAVATYGAVEPAGDQIEWTVVGDDGALFSIDNGILSFNDPPDYESQADSDENNAYVVAVQASDGTETASLNVTIKVTDVNEGPTIQQLRRCYRRRCLQPADGSSSHADANPDASAATDGLWSGVHDVRHRNNQDASSAAFCPHGGACTLKRRHPAGCDACCPGCIRCTRGAPCGGEGASVGTHSPNHGVGDVRGWHRHDGVPAPDCPAPVDARARGGGKGC